MGSRLKWDHCFPSTTRPKCAELTTRGWPWINLHAVGLLRGALILSIELPSYAPTGAKWTSVNMGGPHDAVKGRGYILDRVVGGEAG
jgi:hypothetical protein